MWGRGPCPHHNGDRVVCQEDCPSKVLPCVKGIWLGMFKEEGTHLLPLFRSTMRHAQPMVWYGFWGDFTLFCVFFAWGSPFILIHIIFRGNHMSSFLYRVLHYHYIRPSIRIRIWYRWRKSPAVGEAVIWQQYKKHCSLCKCQYCCSRLYSSYRCTKTNHR